MKRSVLFLLPFEKLTGMGHLTREAEIAATLKAQGYRTVLWSDSDVAGLSPNFKKDFENNFDEKLTPACLIGNVGDKERFPAAESVKDLEKIEDLAAVIVDDFRRVRDPQRIETLKALADLAHRRGAKATIVGSSKNLEFELFDHVVNFQMLIDESLYSKETMAKIIGGLGYVPIRVRAPLPLPEALPQNAFGVMLGATGPLNVTQPVLEGMIGGGYNPVLIAKKSNKPEDLEKQEKWQETLAKFPQSAWLSGLSGGQMQTLRQGVKFMFIGPGSVTCAEQFYTRCPFVGVYSNPTLGNSIAALDKMGLPTLRAQNHDELMAAWEKNDNAVTAKFGKDDIQKAVKRLEALGYIQNRLPDAPPFNQVDEHGAERLVKELGL
jgi:hypothetical protein